MPGLARLPFGLVLATLDNTAAVLFSIFLPLLQLFLSPTFLTGLLGYLLLVLLLPTKPDQNTLPTAWHQEMFDPRWPRCLAATTLGSINMLRLKNPSKGKNIAFGKDTTEEYQYWPSPL